MDTSHFTGRLLKGEKIVWCGRPAQGLFHTRFNPRRTVSDPPIRILRPMP
jgi:hypothetical protein